jgi:hypothetical protein
MMWVQPSADDSSPATVQLMRSPLPSCLIPTWVDIQATCPAAQDTFIDTGSAGNTQGGWSSMEGCLENHSFGLDDKFSSSSYNMRMVEIGAANPNANRAICWGADGVVYTGGSLVISLDDANGASNVPGLQGAIFYGFKLYDGTDPVGVGRTLSIPLGAAPTIMRWETP